MRQTALRVGILQRVLPGYRNIFFDTLAKEPGILVSVFAGEPQEKESLGQVAPLLVAQQYKAKNLHFFKNKYFLCFQENSLHWLNEFNPNVLIVEANPRYLHLPFVIRWMKKRKHPVIGWGLGSPFSHILSSAVKYLWLKQFDALIAYSEQGRQEFIDLHFPPEAVFTAPNAITRRPEHPPMERREIDIGNATKVLFVGRLQERKNIDLLIQACAALPKSIQPLLEIIGDGPERGNLEKLAQEIYPRTTFHGAKYGEELDYFFQSADLFVLPGTGGLAIQQAMTHALPVIVAEADGTQQDLVKENNGWLIPKGNVYALQNALEIALGEPTRLREMGRESYRIVHDEINVDVMVSQFMKAIHYVLGEEE
jgi:glycosyltransferase involved in cell wall biosynthesis